MHFLHNTVYANGLLAYDDKLPHLSGIGINSELENSTLVHNSWGSNGYLVHNIFEDKAKNI